jgi:MoaA/NifB/PqqE/SkfB family radical SAM enzyme
MAFVDPTLFCNLRCPACPTGTHAGLRPRATLDWAVYKAFMDEVGDYLFKLYLYNLGEPLLHKQAPEMVKYAKAKEIFVMISSNLSFQLSDEYLERLITSGLDVLVVALDGMDEETYQKYRQGGDFELVKSNMARIQAMKQKLGSPTPSIVWQFLIFQHNEHQVDLVKQQYKEWGADEYCVGGAYMPTGSLAEGFSPSTRPEFDIYDASHFHRKKTIQAFMEKKPCSWLYGATVLNANGKVSPCSYTAAEKDDFGQYVGIGFSQVWNGPRFAEARELTSQRNAAWLASENWDAIGSRMNGRAMGVANTLEPGELICRRCPVPFLQDVVDHELCFDEKELLQYIRKNYELSPEERELLASLTK